MIDAPPKFAAVRNLPSAYDLFVSIAAVISIGGITWNMLLPDTSEVSKLLEIFDWAFCALFLGDYIRQIVLSKNKLKYIFTWGIFDLVSSIPAVGTLRYTRLARILRVIRMLRAGRMLVQVYRRDRTSFTVAAMMAGGLIVILGVCVAVLHVEQTATGASIKTAEDAAWWGVVTVSTVGYGHFTPVTPIGRMLAVILMIVGIGLFATFAGAIANIFMRQVQGVNNADLDRQRIAHMEQRQYELMRLIEERLPAKSDRSKPE
jgi:voltage-gated potassium channel